MENFSHIEDAAKLREEIARMEAIINREKAGLESAPQESRRVQTPSKGFNLPPTRRDHAGQAHSHSNPRQGFLPPSRSGRSVATSQQHRQPQHGQTRRANPPKVYEVTVEGIRFTVAYGGSKLNRVRHQGNDAIETPRSATVAGVLFLRSKGGNLYRASAIKQAKYIILKPIGPNGSVDVNDLYRIKKHQQHGSQLCPRFTRTGSCRYGSECYYMHNPEKVAVCSAYLMQGQCPRDDSCDLSHKLTAARVMPCSYYQRGACTNPVCRFPHIATNVGGPVCEAFARLGYCERAESCPDRHANECPDYSNKGECSYARCRLPHVVRAGTLRSHAASAGADDEGESSGESDVSSVDDDVLSVIGDADSAQDASSAASRGRAFSQQADFVRI